MTSVHKWNISTRPGHPGIVAWICTHCGDNAVTMAGHTPDNDPQAAERKPCKPSVDAK